VLLGGHRIENMKYLYLIAIASLGSLLAMIGIDFVLGARAELLNAWSVVERLLGRTPSAGDSIVARKFGASGELICVLLVNLLIGTCLGRWLGPWLVK
jgi:hypothetical protein